MKYTKDGVVEDIAPEQIKKYQAHGWVKIEEKKVQDEVIRLKPTVKYKATVKALDEANNKGDE